MWKITNIFFIFRDFVFSKSFEDIICRSKKQDPPYYCQFTLEDKAFHEPKRRQSLDANLLASTRNAEVENLLSRPPPAVLAYALKALIFDGLHQRFKLGAAFPKELTDKDIDKEIEAIFRIDQGCINCICPSPRFYSNE